MSSSGEHMSGHPAGGRGYLSSWRISLRLAARDMRRHRGRAALVVLLIGLPLLVIAAGATFSLTKDVSAKEGIGRTMGTSQAYITQESGGEVEQQSADGLTTGSSTGRAAALPGLPRGADATTAAIQSLTGGTVHPLQLHAPVTVELGNQRISATLLGIDGRDDEFRGMATLVSGRWPRTAGEVLVSRAGAAEGLPTSGTLILTGSAGKPRTLHIVGRADTPDAQSLVGLPTGPASAWLLSRGEPVTWHQIRWMNTYGLTVQSRAVILNPTDADRDSVARGLSNSPVPAAVWTALITGLVLVIALLAGPAFAASGTRQRRSLGLLAINGATRRQLRRYLLAQALLLGALSAVISIVLGAVLGAVAIRLYAHWTPTAQSPGPVEIAWWGGILLAGVAIFAALVAAFIPSVVASRLKLIEVLRGQVSRQRVRVGWPLGGLVLAVVGGFLVTYSLRRTSDPTDGKTLWLWALVVGGVALFGGALLTVPWLLLQISRSARVLPVPLRVAARDVGRQRGRAVATVGAVLATVAMLTATCIVYASSDRFHAKTYQPMLPMGTGMVSMPQSTSDDATRITTQVRHEMPPADVIPLTMVGKPVIDITRTELSAAYLSDCRDAQALGQGPAGECDPVASSLAMNGIIAGTPAQLRSVFRLDASDVKALEAGEALLPSNGSRQTDVASRTLHVVAGTGTPVAAGVRNVTVAGAASVSVRYSKQVFFTYAPPTDAQSGLYAGTDVIPAVLVSDRTVARLPGTKHVAALMIDNPGGISPSEESAVRSVLGANTQFEVERGYESNARWVFLAIAIGFGLLVLIATLASTALSQAESRADSATLASLGAPARLRRLIVGSNAALVGLVGALLGVVVGAVPGIAVAYPLTTQSLTDGTQSAAMISIPWQPLVVVVVAVPLLAGLLAGAVTRGRPPMTRRLA